MSIHAQYRPIESARESLLVLYMLLILVVQGLDRW